MMADESGTVVGGRYRLGPVLGRGGMAEVRRGRDLRLERPVAVKLLRAELASDPQLRARFEREARAAARLRHPHAVWIYDTGEDAGLRPFIVMELLPGETLADRISAGPLPESSVRRLASEILGALDAAHSAGILHRDVKPANILFNDEGAAKVADFGIAKTTEAGVDTDLTTTGHVLGTLAYLAPERTEGKAATPASDLWSLGVVLYEALTGQRPFSGNSAFAAALAARQGTMTPLAGLRPDLSPRLAAGIERAVAPRPGDRFASAAAMAAAIGVGLAGAGLSRRGEDGSKLVGETKRLTAETGRLPPEETAGAAPTRQLAGAQGRKGSRPSERKGRAGAHRKKRRRRAWLAAGVTAVVALVAVVAVAAGGVLGGSTAPRTTGDSSPGHTSPGHSRSSASTPASTLTPLSTGPTTTSPPPPSTTAPATTVPPPSLTTTTAPPPTSPLPKGRGPHPGHGGPGDQGGGGGGSGGQDS